MISSMSDMVLSDPLVSVAIIAYQSALTIEETLDSIADQTYRNIELIISDDGSTDGTVDIANNWLKNHQGRFVRTQIVSVEKNTGVTFNYIRAEANCQGTWIKNIDGDDKLIPTAIEDYIGYAKANPDVDIIYSRIKVFGISDNLASQYVTRYDFSFFDKTAAEKYEMAKNMCIVPPMTAFINIEKVRSVGLRYDERIPMMEDRPYMLNAIRSGLNFGFLDKEVFLYRVRRDSLCNTNLASPVFYESQRLCYYYYSYSHESGTLPESEILELVKKEIKSYNRLYGYRLFKVKVKSVLSSLIGKEQR